MFNHQNLEICNICNRGKHKRKYKGHLIKLCLKCEKYYEKSSKKEVELKLVN